MKSEASTKDRILDAAERVIVRDGVGRLTLEAVAAEASLSKGGVLYNFPTKDDLIKGMIHRLIHIFESEMARFSAEDPDPAGRRMRAYLRASFPEAGELSQRCNQVAAAVLAAVATNPALLEPLREHFRAWQQWIKEDGLEPVTAAIIRLAAEGLWMADLFGVEILDADLRRRVVERLRDFTRGNQAEKIEAVEEVRK